ncbi:MAG: hypothetical protein IPK32_19260 [Verrucomicrobiaceae bacterium]|nr:hypothetical protein [Verrucomicrobiaceae bacterium]
MRGRDFIINALIAPPPDHPLWLELMSRMVSDYRPRRCLEFHATYVIRMAIAKLDAAVEAYSLDHDDITVLSHEAFYASPPAERLPENRRRLGLLCHSSLRGLLVLPSGQNFQFLPPRLAALEAKTDLPHSA